MACTLCQPTCVWGIRGTPYTLDSSPLTFSCASCGFQEVFSVWRRVWSLALKAFAGSNLTRVGSLESSLFHSLGEQVLSLSCLAELDWKVSAPCFWASPKSSACKCSRWLTMVGLWGDHPVLSPTPSLVPFRWAYCTVGRDFERMCIDSGCTLWTTVSSMMAGYCASQDPLNCRDFSIQSCKRRKRPGASF